MLRRGSSGIRRNSNALLVLGLLAVAGPAALAQTRLYVKPGTPAGDDGASWATAFDFLQDAIAHAAQTASAANPVEIWVAEGTYRPDEDALNPTGRPQPGARDFSFNLSGLVSIIGGFRGLPGDEGINNNTTRPLNGATGRPSLASVLSGDIGD